MLGEAAEGRVPSRHRGFESPFSARDRGGSPGVHKPRSASAIARLRRSPARSHTDGSQVVINIFSAPLDAQRLHELTPTACGSRHGWWWWRLRSDLGSHCSLCWSAWLRWQASAWRFGLPRSSHADSSCMLPALAVCGPPRRAQHDPLLAHRRYSERHRGGRARSAW